MLLGAESRHPGRTGSEALGSGSTGTLDSQRLAHDGATTSENLEVGDGAAAGTGAGTGGRRERTEGRGRGAFEERAHCPGLLEEGLHGGNAVNAIVVLVESREMYSRVKC